jgi:hypothetical protein
MNKTWNSSAIIIQDAVFILLEHKYNIDKKTIDTWFLICYQIVYQISI